MNELFRYGDLVSFNASVISNTETVHRKQCTHLPQLELLNCSINKECSKIVMIVIVILEMECFFQNVLKKVKKMIEESSD